MPTSCVSKNLDSLFAKRLLLIIFSYDIYDVMTCVCAWICSSVQFDIDIEVNI